MLRVMRKRSDISEEDECFVIILYYSMIVIHRWLLTELVCLPVSTQEKKCLAWRLRFDWRVI
jgi:hypothetical protein